MKKIIIEIPDEFYDGIYSACDLAAKHNLKRNEDDLAGEVYQAVYKGTPLPENATNGDAIMAMFPNGDLHDYDYCDGYVIYEVNYADCKFTKDWWNAPYNN